MQHFQDVLQPESHQSIDEHMCKFKGKSLMCQFIKNNPINWGFKFWCHCGSKSGYMYEFDMYLEKKTNTDFCLGESVNFSFFEVLKTCFWQLFFKSEAAVETFGKQDLWNWKRQGKSNMIAQWIWLENMC